MYVLFYILAGLCFIGTVFFGNKAWELQQNQPVNPHKKVSTVQRPYLIPKLVLNPPYFTIDGQSVMTFKLVDEKFLYLRFRLANTENVPALNLRGMYDSPTQKNVPFDMGENVIFPNSLSERVWTPWINIQTVVDQQDKDPFNVTLTIKYDGKNSPNNQKYLSLLKLTLQKSSDDYRLLNEEVVFGTEI